MEKGKQTSKRIEYDTYDEQASMEEVIYKLGILQYRIMADKTKIEQQLKEVQEITKKCRTLKNQIKNIFNDPEDNETSNTVTYSEYTKLIF